MPQIEIPYTPNAKQARFHEIPRNVTEAVYGGAKGGGKSCGFVMECLAYGIEHPKADMYLFRETYDDLEANLVKEWKQKVPAQLYTYNESKHIATLYNGTSVKFRYVKSHADAEKYQGRSIDWIGVDELTKHEEKTIQELLSCVRSPRGFPATFRATCNPGGIGHPWVKKRYIDSTKKGEQIITDQTTGNRIAFIPATVYDNEVLMKNDPNYAKRLENLPEAKRKAFLLGDWDSYEGQAFAEWNYDIHVCRPFIIPDYWRRWMACDNGYTDPFAWYWFAVSPDGQVFVYREFTRNYSDEKLTYKQQAEKVNQLMTHYDENNQEEKESISHVVAGLDAWADHPLSRDPDNLNKKGKTIIDFYQEGGLFGFVKCLTDRKLRKGTLHEYLTPYYNEQLGRKTAKIQIFSTCKKAIETIPQQIEDENDPEKVAETNYDHWYDGITYGLVFHHISRSKTPGQPKGIIAEHKDKMAKQMVNHRFRRFT